MDLSAINRRSLLGLLMTACGQFWGCRHQPQIPMHIWVRDPCVDDGGPAVPTTVLPTLGEGPWDLRHEFQQALSSQLRKSMLMKIVDEESPVVVTACACESSTTTWNEQLVALGNKQALQAVVSKFTYFQPTAPVKLGVVVELKDVTTQETLRQVEGVWDAPHCHPPITKKKWRKPRACEPAWSEDLAQISPRHLVEQAAMEIALELHVVGMTGNAEFTDTGESGPVLAP